MADNYLNKTGLQRFFNNIKNLFVPVTRKVNNKALSSDISLTPSDIGAMPNIDGFDGTGSNGEVTVFKVNTNSTGYKLKAADFDDTDTSPSSSKYQDAFQVLDKNDHMIGFLEEFQETSGQMGFSIAARKYVSGNYISNYIYLTISNDGTLGYTLASPSAFRNAISAVAKTGDTMTGNLHINRDVGAFLNLKSNTIDSQIGKTIPDSNSSLGGYDVYDGADTAYRVFFSEVIKTTNDDLYKSFILRRKNASGTEIRNGFYLHINASGTPTVSFTDTATVNAWRNALGFPIGSNVSSVGHYYNGSGYPYIRYTDTSSNQHQIVLADNGLSYQTLASGSSSWSTVWSLRNIAMGNPTIASGVGATVASNVSGKTGDLVSINLRLNGAKLAAGTADICTLPSGFRPSDQAFAVLLINNVYRNGAILNTGVVRVYSGAAVNSVEVKILSTFMI